MLSYRKAENVVLAGAVTSWVVIVTAGSIGQLLRVSDYAFPGGKPGNETV